MEGSRALETICVDSKWLNEQECLELRVCLQVLSDLCQLLVLEETRWLGPTLVAVWPRLCVERGRKLDLLMGLRSSMLSVLH